MKYLPLAFFLVILTCCKQELEKTSLAIAALPIKAAVLDSVLAGPSILDHPNKFVWGGSVIKGEDGKYHMLYSTWPSGDSTPKFSDSWVLLSQIAYAVSDFPDRDFKFQKVVLTGRLYDGDSSAWDAQMVHNPHIQRFDGKYYLYYIGSKDPGIQPIGSKGESLNLRNRVQQSQCIGVISFNDFSDLIKGKFKRPDNPILTPRTRVKPHNIVNPSPDGTEPKPDNIIVVNPSVVQRPSDGKYLLYFKGNFYNPNWRGIHGVAIGDSPEGPFTALDDFVFDIRNEDGTIASGEDPYVWYHQDHQKFYSVLKDFTGKITEGKPGLAILESKDGITWSKPEQPFFMKKELKLPSGEIVEAHHLERPQFLIGQNGDPEVMYAACTIVQVGPRNDGTSFNVQIPLKSYE